jgi:peptidoglycan/xylan/chitin deacetylase (PgdA/CDA1 family)
MNPGIDVAVCVREGDEPTDDCTRALAREAGAEFRLVRAPLIWQARQRALASSSADVIAFVDPDVVVGEGWLDAMRMAWEASPHSIAAIGGPIRADAPEWTRGRLGLIDLGSELIELDPAERTLFAGNLSFWRRALIGVGGFGPPVDRRDATDWLSEEHEAQRQLGHWGWLTRYAPGMAAERLVDDAHPLRRAYRYGTRTGIAGSRPRGVALKQGAKSAAGAVAAAVQGKRAEALERAARAAENLGAVSQSQRGALTPYADVSYTAVRGQTPPLDTGFSVDVVLLYHRFAVGEPDPLGLCVSPENFEAQLRVLCDGFEVVPLAHIASRVRAGEPGSGRVAITIDDGYVDNLTGGIPLIAQAGLPATLFAATGHIETGRPFFWDEMQRLLTGPGPRPAQLRIGEWTWPTGTPEQRETARKELHRLTQPSSSQQIEQTLRALRTWAGSVAGDPPESTRPVTVAELQQIAATPGIEIGAHTRDHVNLGHQPGNEVQAQIERSRDDVASWTGARPRAFSYPFGIPRHDVSDEARRIAAGAGFEYAVVNQPVPVESGADRFAIPRLFAPDLGRDGFIAWLQGVLN